MATLIATKSLMHRGRCIPKGTLFAATRAEARRYVRFRQASYRPSLIGDPAPQGGQGTPQEATVIPTPLANPVTEEAGPAPVSGDAPAEPQEAAEATLSQPPAPAPGEERQDQ